MADQAKGKGIAPIRASNLADLGKSSRPLLPKQTLLEDKEDSQDYSKVIEALKYIAKEPYLGPAIDNIATSNLDPPIDTGSKEGCKDTITSSKVKELSKKAYTIPDNKSKKEDVYDEFHALTFSTYKKGLSAFNAEFNGYLTKLTKAKRDIDPSLILNLFVAFRTKSRNPAIEVYRAAYIANSSNLHPNSNSNPSKKAIEEEEEESNSSSNSSSSSDSNTQLA
ncbi:hypothetical protein P8C59_003182 [Phyllachora maydis]|uniref:Uncharacterized protein n=1 Tax=Phyllachora maydis TaxID=1825666 RepID=A0AAD9I050_9PEZI|nr:hypothetical protein P8C59_003182 [Phyllachora maydis]